MSFPNNETTWALIKYNHKIYKMFKNPISAELLYKYNKVKKVICTAPGKCRDFIYSIENNKLYLCKIVDKLFNTYDLTQEVIGKRKKFAKWYSGKLRLLIKRKPCKLPYRKREIIELEIKNGILIKESIKEEKYKINGISGLLWDYITKYEGLFWVYDNEIYEIKKEYQEIKRYSFKKYWREVQTKNSILECFSYNELPRGKVVYNEKKGSHKIFATEEILKSDLLKEKINNIFKIEKDLVEYSLLKN